MARELGLEPRTTESKSVVLPLHHSRTNLVVTEGIDPSSSAYETATHPSTSRHLGVSNENRTHDSGITTRGFATKLWTPYRNTLDAPTLSPTTRES